MIDFVLVALVIQSDVVIVPAQIVEFIDIEAIALIGNYFEHPNLLVGPVWLALDQSAYQPWINVVVFSRVFLHLFFNHVVEEHF